MAGTILSYLKDYGDIAFSEMPFNDVDALILCQLAYLKFDGLVPDVNVSRRPVLMKQLASNDRFGYLFSDERYEKVNRELYEGMISGQRYGKLKLNAYVNLIEKEWETQFSAVTCYLENGSRFLAFRGTDESIVGWKEDCNMTFLNPIPAQVCARKYCHLVASRWRGDFMLGGHSKGGNLAVYAGMNCHPTIQKRILRIYNMDGPGFRPEILKECAYERVRGRVRKLLPHSSLIGMLFEQDLEYEVVESRNTGLLQHDPFSWIVEEDHFVEAESIYNGRLFLDQTINEWMLSLSEEELKRFIDALFTILEASKAQDLIAFGADKRRSMLKMAEAMKEMDPKTSRMMVEILKKLFEIAGRKVIREINQKLNHLGAVYKVGK